MHVQKLQIHGFDDEVFYAGSRIVVRADRFR